MSHHKVVVGLGFGDEGKGTIVDFLTAQKEFGFDYVVRFSGGPQAAHNVVTDDGRHHTFAQFGSGSFNEVPTILTRHMLVNPFNMAREAIALGEKIGFDPMSMMTISENCLLVLPWHWAINQLEEIRRGDGRHGSCGQGIGVAQKFALDYPDLAIRAKDMYLDRDSFVAKATLVRELLKAEYGTWTKEQMFEMHGDVRTDFHRTPGNVQGMIQFFVKDQMPVVKSDAEIDELIYASNCVWEGSQGALLDEWKGFHPYTTWSTTTAHTAMHILNDVGVAREDIEVIGVTRSYHTRHGAGPFPSEIPDPLGDFEEEHNDYGKFQGGWRVGALDLTMLKYGVDINEEIDSIAMTHMDKEYILACEDIDRDLALRSGNLEAQEMLGNELMSQPARELVYEDDLTIIPEMVKILTGVPVTILSYGPQTVHKEWVLTKPENVW